MATVQDENYLKVVEAVSKRLTHLLKREVGIGTSSRVTGSARMTNSELHERLEQLRDKLSSVCAQTISAVQIEPKAFESGSLPKSLKKISRAIHRKSFKGMHERNLHNTLCGIISELLDVRETLQEGCLRLGHAIDPDIRFDILLPDEVEMHCRKTKEKAALVACRSASEEIGSCLSEANHILKGRFGWKPSPNGGPYEKRRGANIAAHLLGMSCGLGLYPTRADSSARRSACDALLDARLNCAWVVEGKVVKAFDEIPMGYDGMEHIWRAAQTDEDLKRSKQIGLKLGERMRES